MQTRIRGFQRTPFQLSNPDILLPEMAITTSLRPVRKPEAIGLLNQALGSKGISAHFLPDLLTCFPSSGLSGALGKPAGE